MYVVAGLSGLLLGVFYFGGLWLTVQKMSQMERPLLFLAGSFIVRTAVVLLGFYWVSNGRIELLAVSLIAFLIARFGITRTQLNPERKGKRHGHQP